ncbi:hypothetical protein AX16_000742 [Volvariella volvacea WC 439]|nr:hypothetical protein AX16_000742 [Volvariella volvacea WC 439]
MASAIGRLCFDKKKFCCCLPVRIGVIIMSAIGMLLAGLLMIVIWFEVSSNHTMEKENRIAFIIAGLVETLLFVASILGFVGAVVRKQTFVQAYAYIIYFHFFLNLGVAIYFLYVITRVGQNAAMVACLETIQNEDAEDQCVDLLKIAKAVYIVVSTIVILTEMYGAIIVARYVHQIKEEKRRKKRASRAMASESGNQSLLHSRDPSDASEFNPYQDAPSHSSESTTYSHGDIPPPIEVGYGGGSWTHQDITNEEKARLKRLEESESSSSRHSGHDAKAPGGPTPPLRT